MSYKYTRNIIWSLSLLLLFSGFSNKDIGEKLKGKWLIYEHQAFDSDVMLGNNTADLYIGANVLIDDTMSVRIAETTVSKYLDIVETKCKYKPSKIKKIKNPEEYFYEMFKIKAKRWKVDNSKDIFFVQTGCEDSFFNYLIYNSTDDVLMTVMGGFVFTMKRSD